MKQFNDNGKKKLKKRMIRREDYARTENKFRIKLNKIENCNHEEKYQNPG
jgi:hypothetical protein